MGPRELRPRKRLDYDKINRGEYANIRTISGVKAYYPPSDLTDAEIVDLSTIMARDLKRLEVDDSSPQAIIEQVVARIYRISTLLERYIPVDDIGDESISVGKALNIDAAMGDRKFEHSIKAEILDNLITKTGTLEAISSAEVNALPEHTFIHTVVKCKRKQNSDGSYDKHKARTAARGDEYLRKLLARGQPPPASFSPTINALTFQFVLQVATSKNLHRATQDIKYAYLNAPLPEDMEPIITKLDDNIADICGLPRGQLYRIRKALYGLPASGRLWYEHYTQSLQREGYTQSKFDPCLFFRINDLETTYICLFVDDTYVFSNQLEHMNTFVTSMQKYYQVTLDTKGDSFLGIQFTKQPDGSTILTQPKLLYKLLKEYPPIGRKYTQDHPYGPMPSRDQSTSVPSPITDQSDYLRLLGMLLYMTKSRPDIMAAVSFGASKASRPTTADQQQLMYIVEYIRKTPDRGHRIYAASGDPLQFYCTVDASYLLHPDSKGQTGYTIGLYKEGTFYNRSAKQALVSTSSTHAEMRAIFTLVKDLLFLFSICLDLQLHIQLPAIIMEDNSAVITITTDDQAYLKKCKHFLMVINYIREQVNLGLVEIQKIAGEDNMADLHTKPLRDGSFERHVPKVLGETSRV
eukprot:gene30971-biopygen24828